MMIPEQLSQIQLHLNNFLIMIVEPLPSVDGGSAIMFFMDIMCNILDFTLNIEIEWGQT